MPSDLIFSLREVEIKFGKKTIFQNLDLNLHKKDMVALVGKNGVGKSTLMKIISGEQDVDNGIIWNFPDLKVSYFNQKFEGRRQPNRRDLQPSNKCHNRTQPKIR